LKALGLIHSTDKDLVIAARTGSEAAYRELLGRYQRPLFSLIYRMVRDRELAEDLAQETFVKVFNNLGSYDPRYKFASWIFKIGSNLAIDSLRRKALPTVSLDGSSQATSAEEMEASKITPICPELDPEQVLESKELGREIEAAIGELQTEYCMAIVLRHVEGRSYEEIAEIMEAPLGTVKTYIHRGRAELRERLAHLRIQA